jgi:hypothetical protein
LLQLYPSVMMVTWAGHPGSGVGEGVGCDAVGVAVGRARRDSFCAEAVWASTNTSSSDRVVKAAASLSFIDETPCVYNQSCIRCKGYAADLVDNHTAETMGNPSGACRSVLRKATILYPEAGFLRNAARFGNLPSPCR